MNLVLRPAIVPDEMSRQLPGLPQDPPEHLMDNGTETGAFGGGWIGMVNEFRNQLTIFLAGTNELVAKLPRAVAAQVADTLGDMESSAEFLQTLLTWMDASVEPGAKTISDVEDLLIRAKMLASTGLSPRVAVRLNTRPAGVRNRGAAIECALAALITELGRISTPWQPAEACWSDGFDVTASVNPQRGSLSILLFSVGRAPPASGSWRVSLAKALLAQVGGTVQPLDRDASAQGAGFDVRFRFQ